MRASQIETTPCCGQDPHGVRYNPHNKVVQCHHCGNVWEPMGGPIPTDLRGLFDHTKLKNADHSTLPLVIAALGDPRGAPLQVARSPQDLGQVRGEGVVRLWERAIAALRRGSIGVVFLNVSAVLDRLGDQAFKAAYPSLAEEPSRDPASSDREE